MTIKTPDEFYVLLMKVDDMYVFPNVPMDAYRELHAEYERLKRAGEDEFVENGLQTPEGKKLWR